MPSKDQRLAAYEAGRASYAAGEEYPKGPEYSLDLKQGWLDGWDLNERDAVEFAYRQEATNA